MLWSTENPDIEPEERFLQEYAVVVIGEVNIAKGTTDPRVEFISQVQTQILIKFHLQNLDQASSSKS